MCAFRYRTASILWSYEELRVPADRPAGAVGVALVRREPHWEESAAAAEEMGSIPREEQVFLRWTIHPCQSERRPSYDSRPYCCHMWPFLCIRVSNLNDFLLSHKYKSMQLI